MATVAEDFSVIARPGRGWNARGWQDRFSKELPIQFLSLVFCMFAFRDTLTSSFRYFLSLAHLNAVWFIPDGLSLIIFGYFAWQFAWRRQSAFGVLLVISFITSTIVGLLFMSSGMFAFISSVKLFLPFFVGCAFAGRSVTDIRWVRIFLLTIMCVSILGLLISPYVDFPWLGQTLDNFGQSKGVGRVWWTGGVIRYGGFAGESTMAAYMSIFPFFLLHRTLPKWVNIAFWVPIWWALHNSTSKTAMIVFGVFNLFYLVTLLPKIDAMGFARRAAKLSFLLVPTPFIMMLLLSGVDLSDISQSLFSLQDRINNTWRFPFQYLSQNFPVGLLTGCGMGCFTYPMEYTDLAALTVPVDSFFVITYLMMGVPFLFLIVGMFTSTYKSKHLDKLTLIVMTNIYVVTVQCYGPSTATILVGYAFSDMFLTTYREWKRPKKVVVGD